MKNPNALIAMAQVAQNVNNPYETFCEYVKYCIFTNVMDTMTLFEVREAIGKEFGIYIPHNILIKCLSHIQAEGIIKFNNHQIEQAGSFDVDSFDKNRESYRVTELAIIQALIQYVSKYGREWTAEYARELLIKSLDRNGMAYDIFLHETRYAKETYQPADCECEMVVEMLPDDEEIEQDDIENQPLFTDDFFVGKFIEKTLKEDTVQRDYLKKICEGLMICVGTYQLPSEGVKVNSTQINGTSFFFDTKLLLRFLGCAGESAVAAALELVALIQKAGGKILYYQQTLDEMEHAFNKAINSLTCGRTPEDDEMRLYTMRIKNDPAIVRAKKANLRQELASAKIFLTPHMDFSNIERIRFGFDQDDLQQYMRSNLPWDPRVVDNDALAIWETHMRRHGNYSDYCGSRERLPVFVTTNLRLIGIVLQYHENRPNTQAIRNWAQNRLPVITDIRLTCRLWSPADHNERLPLLYLTANAVAAKRPTKRYLESIRTLAIQLGEQVPEYSEICLPAYFDDAVTDKILEHTLGEDDKLDINSFASSIAELSDWKAKEQKEITNKVIAERDGVAGKLEEQTNSIIEGAVESGLKLLGWRKAVLWIVINWVFIATILFTAVSAVVSILSGNWKPMFGILIPVILKAVEFYSASPFVEKPLAKWLLPKMDVSIDKRLLKEIRKAELPYKDVIIMRIKERTPLWVKCKQVSEN